MPTKGKHPNWHIMADVLSDFIDGTFLYKFYVNRKCHHVSARSN